ncbi:hypothetical protein MTR_2g060940 [Medicago truncatula]|uniref:Uncharacterized protein n=1 Tax=Medicago truncatula TaxID=3880 RepID=G7IJ23_MEDTR|nr:hypothetical protein MTR_2g060940 [Medicago truncatula]
MKFVENQDFKILKASESTPSKSSKDQTTSTPSKEWHMNNGYRSGMLKLLKSNSDMPNVIVTDRDTTLMNAITIFSLKLV